MNSFLRKVFSHKHLFRTLFTGFLLITTIGVWGQISITSLGTAFTQNFDGMGTSATATLPTGFRVSGGTVYSSGTTATTEAAGTTGTGVLTGTSTGGTYNFANGVTGSATDRALGFLNSSGFTSPRSIMLEITNNSGSTITSLNVSFDYEKYRSGSREFGWAFFHGPDGSNWTPEANGDQVYLADADNSVVSNPPASISKSFTVTGISVANGASYYLRWTFTGVGGSTNGQGIGIDNFSITANTSAGPTSSSTDYFRSRQSGTWGSTSSWESSSDNSTWINATLFPTSSANTITIRNGHTITVSGTNSADQLTIDVGGTLNHSNSVAFTLNNGTGNDMIVNGTYVINGTMPSGTGNIVVNSGGVIRADGNSSPGESDNIAFSTNTLCTFYTGSIFNWNTTLSFQTAGITYFSSATEKPIFRITSAMGNVGGASNTVINGLLEVNGSVTWDNTGTKTFRDGIIGTGTLTQAVGTGTFLITANDAQLGGSGAINLNSTNGLQISSGAIVTMISNKIVNGSTNDFTVANGGRLNCSAYILSGTADFVLASGGTLGIGSSAGITSSGLGNVQTSGRSYSSNANYIYNGSGDQVTGNFTTTPTANTVNFLTAASGGTVTLTNTNLTATALYLNTGYFASGTGQNLNIAAGGNIYGNGGANPNSANAGSITFLGTGTTHGLSQSNPSLYHVILSNGVNFNGTGSASATIMNTLQLNSGGFVTQAPFYQTGSTLIYNTGGTYGRNVEWGSASDQGYPHHVTVQGNTTVNLFSNPITPNELSIGGDLTLGNSTGYGRMNLSGNLGNMTKPLSVAGNLTIGTTSATSLNSQLNLSASVGGDLWLNGNFSRYANGEYNDNTRAIFFKGSGNSTINTPNVTITAGVPTQYFSYLLMQKTVSTADVTLNCPVGIYSQLTLTSGTITSTNTNLLVMNDNSTVAGSNYASRTSGGSDNSFVNGPMRKIGNDNFVFPVGKPLMSSPNVGGHRIIAISAPANVTDAFTAEFYLGNANLMGPIIAPASPYVAWVSRCEYWRLERSAGTSNVNVTLSWNARSNCNVKYVDDLPTLVIVHNTANSSLTGVAPFSGSWDKFGRDGGTTGDVTAGTITWNNVSDYSPFALGTINVNTNPLPFNLSRFNATPSKKNILLDWAVGNNHEQQSYTLERSKDGRTFEAITQVTAIKDVQAAEYTYADEQPLTGWNYYLLRATDKQLKQATSRIIRIWWGQGPAVISVLPNPASEKIVINLSDPSSITEIQIVNSTGQVVKQTRSVQFSNEIMISSLQAGMYYIRLFGKNGLTTKSFVKQ